MGMKRKSHLRDFVDAGRFNKVLGKGCGKKNGEI